MYKSSKISKLSVWFVLILLGILTYIPIVIMLSMSFRNNGQIYSDFWGLPSPWIWKNYKEAFEGIGRSIFNSVFVSGIATIGVVFLSSLSGYVFARLQFPGRNFFYLLILSLMMIPGVLTLMPLYAQISGYGLLNTWWALLLPWIAGGQVFGIILCRTFLEALPNELFECSRIDGATEFTNYWRIAVPLTMPILITLAVMNMIGNYNDFIWPLLTISGEKLQMVTVQLQKIGVDSSNNVQYGQRMAAYIISCLPLLVLFSFGMKYYVSGVTSGAVKG
ncbi:carbohydrate ABC transporter permease [Paenibacillus psychroresistens]|uniref:Carbohydrate ABC transporter permease n=1 Tax=Paenibacillus psychroresistens TaxID=1778678 RepID=A0A6B8RVM4_9BACL|nr:carbohydrate ABC transporter permease [Paenibacillus psychroresistens]QGQ99685.1 carbohydrate ABC transporter permease [Paenibacillus psychroresistens]